MRIATLNLRLTLDRWPERLPLVVDALAATDAEVIGLQEVALPIRQDHLVADALNARDPDRPYAVHTAPKWGDANPEAVSLLSRVPVAEHEVCELPEGGRVAQRIEVHLDGRPLHVVNTHLHDWPHDDESVREPQLRRILGWLANLDVLGSCVLLGDLNARPGTTTLGAALEVLTNALPDGVMTFPTPLAAEQFPPSQIDHILCSPGLRVVSAGLVADCADPDDPTLYASDHLGILAEIRWADPAVAPTA